MKHEQHTDDAKKNHAITGSRRVFMPVSDRPHNKGKIKQQSDAKFHPVESHPHSSGMNHKPFG
jgi:hypothetical protein